MDSNISWIRSLFLVPGDIIYLDQRKKVPCDCLILEGYCSVIESYLTGESNLILKSPLPQDNLIFSYENSKSIIFQGTEIIECESAYFENDNNYIKCLVINTGFNTYWGSFLQNILFPKKMNFKFYRELKIFLNVMIISYLITIGTMINWFFKKFETKKINLSQEQIQIEKFSFAIKCLDLITVIIPPSLHICMNVISIYFNEILKMKEITCLSEKRLNAAGKVNTIVLDKTGTLTSDGLEIYGFQTTHFKQEGKYESKRNNSNKYVFDVVEKSTKIYNSMHREFWMRYAIATKNEFWDDYQINYRNNPIYFMECLATCLSIDKLKDNKILGNSTDQIIFNEVNWCFEKIDEKWNDIQVICSIKNLIDSLNILL